MFPLRLPCVSDLAMALARIGGRDCTYEVDVALTGTSPRRGLFKNRYVSASYTATLRLEIEKLYRVDYRGGTVGWSRLGEVVA
jgi:hypothetical protein